MLRKLDLSTYVDFCHLGVKLSHGGCTAGAREIFYHVCYHLENDALLRFETDEVCFDVQLFDLAVELHAKDNDDLAIQRVYRLSRMTCSSNLMNLIDHLVERAKTGKLDIACYLRGLGDIVVEKIISANSFDHLLKALKIFHQFHEEQTLLLIWTSICSQCIEEYNLESGDNISLKSRCLFCRLLSTSDDEGNDLMASMAIARNAQDALGCSIDKLTEINSGSSFHYKEVLSFIRRVIKLQEILPVYFHTERIENFCSLFTCIHSEDMCDLVHSILGPKRYLRRNGSVTSLLVERLILQLLNRKEDFLSSTSMEYVSMALEFCVWYGDLNLLKNLLKKLDVRFSASVHSETTKSFATLIATILKEKVAEDASSAINREVFCLLIWKWALLLRNLKNGKIPSFLDCFQTTFKLEKKLENFHKPENLTLEFSQTISYFDFNENLEILKSIFTSEYGDDIDLSLKTLPTSLKIFSTLCNTLSNMIDVEKASHLTVDSLVILMQCFLWLGEEKPIVDFARFLVNLPRSEFSGDALEAIIFEENTADLAAGSPFGVVALGDLIDCRIHQLSPPRAAKDILSRLCPRLLGRSNSNNGRSKRSNSCAELQPEKANERLSKGTILI